MNNDKEVDILEDIKNKYPTYVNPDLTVLSISIDEDEVYLHKTFKGSPDQRNTEALDFIADDDLIELDPIINASLFNPLLTAEENAERFINQLDAYAIAMCFDGIFTEAAEKEVLEGKR